MIRVYYFSRTGDSEKIAHSVAEQTGGVVFRISDNKNWKGPFGFLKGGYYAASRKSLPISYEKPGGEDEIYLCFPVWAGSLPPAARAFADEVGRERIIAVPSSAGGPLKERDGFVRVIDVIGKDKTVRI